MPSILVVCKLDKDGKEIPSTRQAMPFADSGVDSVNAAAEEEHYKKLGYSTRIIRQGREQVSDRG